MTEEKQPENQHETYPVIPHDDTRNYEHRAPKSGRGLALLATASATSP